MKRSLPLLIIMRGTAYACFWGWLSATCAQGQQIGRQSPTVILGPPAAHGQRRAAENPPRAAGFSYQAGYAPRVQTPTGPPAQPAPYSQAGPSVATGPMLPPNAILYGSTYPGYGFGFGSGFGYLGYQFNYPGMTLGYGYLGNAYRSPIYGAMPGFARGVGRE